MRAASCDHCTQIAIARSLGIAEVIAKIEPFILPAEPSLAQKYGNAFEDALVQELKDSLNSGDLVAPAAEGDLQQTIELMEKGVPLIYQGGLTREFEKTLFRGKPDFLVREDWEVYFEDGKLRARQVREVTQGSNHKYVALDAKYGGNAKPAYLLQVGLYVDALDSLGFKAEGAKHGLILGSRRIELFEELELVPAMKLARARLVELISAAEKTQAAGDLTQYEIDNLSWHCSSKQYCSICEYPDLCKLDRELTDDLVRVANITQNQIKRLGSVGITTMTALAEADDSQRPAKMSEETFKKIRRQAGIQLRSIRSGEPEFELFDDPAIQYLPHRSELDIFFDFEGFPYFTERGGLEYLFGNYDWGTGQNEGEPKYELFTEFWAHNRAEEKIAFESFMSWAIDRLKRDPDAHIYHYASYEASALKRLASRHGVYENEVDWLIATGRLIDMYEVVRNSMVIGEESYSIKKLERYYDFQRLGNVQKGDKSIEEYDRWRELDALRRDPGTPAELVAEISREADQIFEDLRFYNLQDVWSTRELYRWLEGLPGARLKAGEDKPDDDEGVVRSSKAIQELAMLQAETQDISDKLAGHEWGLDAEADYKAKIWLALTHSILFYKREDVMFWADIAMRVAMEDAVLEADRGGGLIRNVVEVERIPKEKLDGSLFEEITYEADLDPDDLFTPKEGLDIVARYVGVGHKKFRDFGKIKKIEDGKVTFTRQASEKSAEFVPDALIDAFHIPTTSKQSALLDLAKSIAAAWGSPYAEPPQEPAIMDLLMRRPPRLRTLNKLPVPNPGNYLDAVSKAIIDLDSSVLAIQGPPGSGKTYLAANTIAMLVAQGKRVGVVAHSHAAVENILEECIKADINPLQVMKVLRKGEEGNHPWVMKKDTGPGATWLKNTPGGIVVGGTNFFFCNKLITPYKLDYLFIDEAAQFSLVDCMAVSAIADNLVLMGDPLQLPQVVLAIHPGGVENSALGHYMGDNEILPENMGYFLEVTRRLHPDVNEPVSWLAYEGKLRSHEDTKKHVIKGQQTGLIASAIEHEDNSTSSEEEAEEVLQLVKKLYDPKVSESVLVVAAYNAQVDLIRETLDDAGYTEDKVMVGTVDKYQGREGMGVIFSFAASSSMDAPRGLEFLLDRNRLNVAISRAKATCYLVFSTTLLKCQFRNVEEVKAVSRLAGLLEMAK